MLLNKFKSNHTFNFILFPLLGGLFWLKNIITHHTYPFSETEINNLLYYPFHNLLDNSAFGQNMAALVLFLLIAFIILQICNRYSIIPIRTMFPVTLFVILAGGFTGIHTMHPVYPGTVFFLLSLYRLLNAYEHTKAHSAVFDAGFFLGIAILFYIGLIVLLPAAIIGTNILSRESKWRETVILLLGFLIPVIFGLSFAFYMDSVPELLENVRLNIVTPGYPVKTNVPLLIYTGFLIFLVFLGSLKLLKDYDTKKISTRKYFIVFFIFFIFSLMGVLFIPAVSQEMLLVVIIPVTFLITNFFIFLKSRFWSEFLFLLLLVVVLVMNIVT